MHLYLQKKRVGIKTNVNLVININKRLTTKLSKTKYVTTFIGTGFQAPE